MNIVVIPDCADDSTVLRSLPVGEYYVARSEYEALAMTVYFQMHEEKICWHCGYQQKYCICGVKFVLHEGEPK